MNKLKVGDKVRVYSGIGHIDGIVQDIENGNQISIDSSDKIFHYKQCRKLKPKKKPREFWIMRTKNDQGFPTYLTFDYEVETDVEKVFHVREVKQK